MPQRQISQAEIDAQRYRQRYADTHSQAADFAPMAFPQAQAATMLYNQPMPHVQSLLDNPGRPYHPLASVLGYTDLDQNRIYYRDRFPDMDTVGHELGHAAWQGLTTAQQSEWTRLHHRNPTNDGVVRFPQDASHSFAANFGAYLDRPAQLKAQSPDVYSFLRDLSGVEYWGAGTKPAQAEDSKIIPRPSPPPPPKSLLGGMP